MLVQKQCNKLVLPEMWKDARIFFNIGDLKETALDFSKRTVGVLWFYFVLT